VGARTDEAVAKLAEARRKGAQLSGLEPHEQPCTLEEAYAIQQALIAAWPDQVFGWKVGATSLEVQELFGISEPVYGPVFQNTIFESPATLSASHFAHRLLEAEFTFRFGKRLPARPAPYSRADLLDAVEAVIPSLEIVNPRFSSLVVGNIPQVVADFCANGGAIFGRPCVEWRSLDLNSHPVSLVIDGHERQKGSGSLALGDPVNVLEWLVNKFASTGMAIEAGQFVMTGTVTGLHAPSVGEEAIGRFGSLGEVVVTFT
jgi:2-keto-4-pentenoate hydratase